MTSTSNKPKFRRLESLNRWKHASKQNIQNHNKCIRFFVLQFWLPTRLQACGGSIHQVTFRGFLSVGPSWGKNGSQTPRRAPGNDPGHNFYAFWMDVQQTVLLFLPGLSHFRRMFWLFDNVKAEAQRSDSYHHRLPSSDFKVHLIIHEFSNLCPEQYEFLSLRTIFFCNYSHTKYRCLGRPGVQIHSRKSMQNVTMKERRGKHNF